MAAEGELRRVNERQIVSRCAGGDRRHRLLRRTTPAAPARNARMPELQNNDDRPHAPGGTRATEGGL